MNGNLIPGVAPRAVLFEGAGNFVCSRTFCSAVSLPMLTSCYLARRVINRGMTHPGLLMALMVAATPKQIAMARQTANSESHILHPPGHDHSF
jgi:hypothetical protein